jgi:ketosteroid isomerase-like protein
MQTRFVLRTTALLLSAAALASCSARSDSFTTNTQALPSGEARTTATLPAELSVAHPALYRAWQGNDPLAMRPWYAENARIITSTAEYNGWEDMHTRWLTPTLKGMSDFLAMPSSFTREGNDIIEMGRYSFRMTQDGTVQQVRGAYAQRWQRQPNGNWRVVSANIVSEPPANR